MTDPDSARHRSISRTWPSCSAPMVGTSPMRRPPWRAAVVARRTSSTDSTSSTTRLTPRRPAAVWAIGIVQARVGDQQVVEDLAAEDRLGHDPGDILGAHPPVPDPLRIDHHGWAVFALLQAAGMIGARHR